MKKTFLSVSIAMTIAVCSYAQAPYSPVEFDDNSFLRIATAIADHKIVGIGESAHGVEQFHRWNFSLVRYLLEKKGLKVFAMEDNYAPVKKLNDYVCLQTEELSVDTLIKGLYWIWQSRDLTDLVVFMRNYNKAQRDKSGYVSIVRVDMQNAAGVYDVVKFLKEKGRDVSSVSDNDLKLVAAMGRREKYNFKRLPTADKDAIRKTIEFLQKSFDGLPATDPEELAIERRGLEIVRQCYENQTAGIFKWMKFRNQTLAKNVIWAERQLAKGGKIVFMAHNGHVADAGAGTGRSLKELEPSYYALLQDFVTGNIINPYSGQKSFISSDKEKRMLPSFFSDKLDSGMFFVDFSSSGFERSVLANYMKDNNNIHDFGATMDSYLSVKANVTCNGIIIHRSVSSSL